MARIPIPASIEAAPEAARPSLQGQRKRSGASLGVGARTAYIEPGSPWENGCVEGFNGTLRDELLSAEEFNTLLEARVLIAQWGQHYNTIRPHSSLGYRPPAPEVVLLGVAMPPGNPGPTGSHQSLAAVLH